jgi:osmotically-inducible protein OsmY
MSINVNDPAPTLRYFDRRTYKGLVNWGRAARGLEPPFEYRRSDEFLRELICERLSQDPAIDAVDVSVDVAQGEVTLTGTVCSRDQERVIEDFLADVNGVAEVHNMLVVRSDEIENRFAEF